MTWCHVRPHEGETFNGGGWQLYRGLFQPATLAPQEFRTDLGHIARGDGQPQGGWSASDLEHVVIALSLTQ